MDVICTCDYNLHTCLSILQHSPSSLNPTSAGHLTAHHMPSAPNEMMFSPALYHPGAAGDRMARPHPTAAGHMMHPGYMPTPHWPANQAHGGELAPGFMLPPGPAIPPQLFYQSVFAQQAAAAAAVAQHSPLNSPIPHNLPMMAAHLQQPMHEERKSSNSSQSTPPISGGDSMSLASLPPDDIRRFMSRCDVVWQGQ